MNRRRVAVSPCRMLPRTLEPEVMDSPAEAQDYDAMDHSVVNRVFVEDFLKVWQGQNPILDVGTGTAQIPIVLCQQDVRARVTAIDAAEHMLVVGRKNVERAGLAERLKLECVDAKAMPYADRSFAAVISNSIVHHIPEPRQVIREMIRVLQPGGVVFVRDLLRPDSTAAVDRLVQTYAGNENSHQQAMFRESLHAALTLDEVRELIGEFGFKPESVRQTSDRHWTWSALNPLAA